MTTRKPALDPFLSTANVDIEPEELLEPEVEPINPTRFQAFKFRLYQYGNRALGSARHFVIDFRDAFVHVSTALAGSLLVLPFVIVVRGVYVLLRTVLTSARDIVLSLVRAIFEVLRLPFRAVSSLFYAFNKRFLFPMLKRVKEDDAFAVVAFVILVAAAIVVYIVLKQFAF